MFDLTLGQTVVLLTGVVLIVAGLFGLVPLVLESRAAAGFGRIRIREKAFFPVQTPPKVSVESMNGAQATSRAPETDHGGIEELFAQTLSLRKDLDALSWEVRLLRERLDAKVPETPITIVQAPKERKSRRRAA